MVEPPTLRTMVLLLLLTAVGSASNWSDLNRLRPGEAVRVEVAGKSAVTASFAAVTLEVLRLASKKGQMDLPRASVRRVERRCGASAPWIGAAVGFVGGLALGYSTYTRKTADECARDPYACAIPAGNTSKGASAAALGALGAAAGALAGRLCTRWQSVYATGP